MPESIRTVLIVAGLIFAVIGGYHRIRAAQAGDRLDRTQEGWATMIVLRVAGLVMLGSVAAWIWNPSAFAWAAFPVPDWVRWIGACGFVLGVSWLVWMFVSLGSNLTDTVVTRREAHFVDHGPYRYVRNPMYTGILMVGVSLGLALGTWLVPLTALVLFGLLARRTRVEEAFLIDRFGDQYLSYMARVGRFFPRVS